MASTREILKEHMSKGKGAHPDSMVKRMRAGGKTNSDMLKMGRNLAKVANQKSPGRKQRGV